MNYSFKLKMKQQQATVR